MGDFNLTLGNEYRSTGSKSFCESQEELMSFITEFDLEYLWRCQNPNDRLHTHFHGKSNTYPRIDWVYTSTNLRLSVKIDHEINTFSNHSQTIVIERELTNFKTGKGFRLILEWREGGRQYIKTLTKFYIRADTTASSQKKCSLKRHLRNIYTKIDAKPHLQNLEER